MSSLSKKPGAGFTNVNVKLLSAVLGIALLGGGVLTGVLLVMQPALFSPKAVVSSYACGVGMCGAACEQAGGTCVVSQPGCGCEYPVPPCGGRLTCQQSPLDGTGSCVNNFGAIGYCCPIPGSTISRGKCNLPVQCVGVTCTNAPYPSDSYCHGVDRCTTYYIRTRCPGHVACNANSYGYVDCHYDLQICGRKVRCNSPRECPSGWSCTNAGTESSKCVAPTS